MQYLSHMIGRASCCWEMREEHAWRGGGAMGAQPSRGLLLRCVNSGVVAKVGSGSTGQGTARPWLPMPTVVEESEGGGVVSGPMALWKTSPVAACSASRVGEEGGEGRDFFLLDDNSFRRPFFSLCRTERNRESERKKLIMLLLCCTCLTTV